MDTVLLDGSEYLNHIEEINDRLFSMHDTVNHAIIKVDEANPLSHFCSRTYRYYKSNNNFVSNCD